MELNTLRRTLNKNQKADTQEYGRGTSKVLKFLPPLVQKSEVLVDLITLELAETRKILIIYPEMSGHVAHWYLLKR